MWVQKGHSSATAILKLINDVRGGMNRRQVAVPYSSISRKHLIQSTMVSYYGSFGSWALRNDPLTDSTPT